MKKVTIVVTQFTILTSLLFTSCKTKSHHSGGVHTKFCFVGDTRITTENNSSIKINNLKVGASVFTYNIKTGALEVAKVLEMKSAKHNNLFELVFEGATLKITNDHPIWVKGKGWASLNPEKTMSYLNVTDVKLLTEGDVCFVLNKNAKIVESILKKATKLTGSFETYTINKLSSNQCFFAEGIVVGVEEITPLQ